VAQQYWVAARVFQRAPLGFKARLEVALGSFTGCGPGDQGGSDGGEQYQVFTAWQPVGQPIANEGGLLQDAVPAIERAFNRAGWSQFQPSKSTPLSVVATRKGFTLTLNADPANPAPLERNWTPLEYFTVAGPCEPVTALEASELSSVPKDYFGTAPTSLYPVQIQAQGNS
jgi:hypothetical protein